MQIKTIYDLKREHNQAAAKQGIQSTFFTRSNMEFFGQTLKDFKMNKLKAGNGQPYYKISAKSVLFGDSNYTGQTTAYFFPDQPEELYIPQANGEFTPALSEKLKAYSAKQIL